MAFLTSVSDPRGCGIFGHAHLNGGGHFQHPPGSNFGVGSATEYLLPCAPSQGGAGVENGHFQGTLVGSAGARAQSQHPLGGGGCHGRQPHRGGGCDLPQKGAWPCPSSHSHTASTDQFSTMCGGGAPEGDRSAGVWGGGRGERQWTRMPPSSPLGVGGGGGDTPHWG